jgi:DHA1 family bicyclomycin/chloramphenicol resistance-like MFS transporter
MLSSAPSSATATPSVPAKNTAMPATLVALILALTLGIQPVTSDLYLPALPALSASFAAPMWQAQYTLSAMLMAFGCSQLIWGPLSDRFGRRPVLLIGLLAYTLAGLASTQAPSMLWLIVWRVLQGAAMGAVVMCARAIVRDLYPPAEGARIMSKGLSGLGVLACLAPPLGSLVSDLSGWRMTLLVPALFSAGTLALVLWRFKETLAQPNPQALQAKTLVRTWLLILRNPTFLAYSSLSAASYGGLFTFLTTSPFVFIQVLGLSKKQFGLVLFLMCFAYLIGTFLCRRLLQRYSVQNAAAMAGGLSLSAGLLMAALAWSGIQNVWSLCLPFALYMLGHGVHQPCGQSGAVGPFPEAAGTAAALNGFLMMLVAFVMGSWLGTHMDGSARPLTYGVAAWSAVLALTSWTLVRRYGRSSQGAPA